MNKIKIRSKVGVGLSLLLLAGTTACGGTDDMSGPRFDEIDVSFPLTAELRDILIGFEPGELDPRGDDRIDPALFAMITAVIHVYADADLRQGIVDHALADWESMEILMGGDPGERGGQELNEERIAAIRVDLENGWEDLPLETFVDLPAVVDLRDRMLRELRPLDD